MAAFVDLEASWGSRRLPFRLRRAEVKRLRIAVDPEGEVVVTAPMHASDEAVIARVSRRGDWIQQQHSRFVRWRPRTPVRQYLSGETHLFLGDQLRLQIEAGRVSHDGQTITKPALALAPDARLAVSADDDERGISLRTGPA